MIQTTMYFQMLLLKISIMNKDKRTIFQENVFCISMYMNLQIKF